MGTYADVLDGVCVNIIWADPAFESAFTAAFPGHQFVGPIDSLLPEPGIGWSYDGTTWTPPAGDDD